MEAITNLTKDQRELIRLHFLEEFRQSAWFSSVSVRPNHERTSWCVSVGVTDDVTELPSTFDSLPLVSYRSARAVHAVAYPSAS